MWILKFLSVRFRQVLKREKEEEEEEERMHHQHEMEERTMFTHDHELWIMEFIQRHEEGLALDDLRLYVKACIYLTPTVGELEQEVQRMRVRHPTLVYEGPGKNLFVRAIAAPRNAGRGQSLKRKASDKVQTATGNNTAISSKSTRRSVRQQHLELPSSPPPSSSSLNLNTEPIAEESDLEEEDGAAPLAGTSKPHTTLPLSPSPPDKRSANDESVQFRMAFHLLRARDVVETFRRPLSTSISFLEEDAKKAFAAGLFELAALLKEEVKFQKGIWKTLKARGGGDYCVDWKGEPVYTLRPRKNDNGEGYFRDFLEHSRGMHDAWVRGDKKYYLDL